MGTPNEYRNLREKAVAVLGGACVNCGIADVRVLEIDHIHGRCDEPKLSHVQRKMFRQIIKGVYDGPPVQVLCGNCHNIKTYEERLK